MVEFLKNKIGVILIIAIIVLFLAPLILSRSAFFEFMAISDISSIGSNIGGLTAPIVGVLTALLLFLTFKESNFTNKLHKENIKIEILRNEINSLENAINDISYTTTRNLVSWGKIKPGGNQVLETYKGPITLLYFQNDKKKFPNCNQYSDFPYLIDLNYILEKFLFIHENIIDEFSRNHILFTMLKNLFNWRWRNYLEFFLEFINKNDKNWDTEFQDKMKKLLGLFNN